MARQKGIIKLAGNDRRCVLLQNGRWISSRERKGGVEADRIKNDPAFVRTRENGAEFGSSAQSGKLLRDSSANVDAKCI